MRQIRRDGDETAKGLPSVQGDAERFCGEGVGWEEAWGDELVYLRATVLYHAVSYERKCVVKKNYRLGSGGSLRMV